MTDIKIDAAMLERIQSSLYCSAGILRQNAEDYRLSGKEPIAQSCDGQADWNMRVLADLTPAEDGE